ncbi:hypothetical protein D3C80_1153000 [compost metagenome]
MHLLQQCCSGIFANAVQVLLYVAGHFRIGTGQGAVEIAGAADDAVHQAVELYRCTEQTLMPAIVQRVAVTETDRGWMPMVAEQSLEHSVGHRYRQLY